MPEERKTIEARLSAGPEVHQQARFMTWVFNNRSEEISWSKFYLLNPFHSRGKV